MTEADKPRWTFELFIYGPFSIQGRWNMEELEDPTSQDPFFLAIELKNSTHGAHVSLKVAADNGHFAHQIALFAIGQWLDVLAIQSNLPLFVSRSEPRPFARERNIVKRLIEQPEWSQTFREAHQLNQHHPAFLQALGWYRRAICSENPAERFSCFCLAIQQLLPTPHTPQHSHADAIRLSFHDLWGNREEWPFLQHRDNQLDHLLELNQLLSSPLAGPTSPSLLVNVLEQSEVLHRTTHAFLTDWRNKKIELPGELYHNNIYIETGWGDTLQ